MQTPKILAIDQTRTPYQTPKLELHGVWQIATGVTLSIGTGVSLPTDIKLETFEWNGEL